MSPLVGHGIIPAGWSQHHRPAVESTMTARCDVHRADDDPGNDSDAWDPVAGVKDPAEDPVIWSGPCRVQALASAVADADAAGQEVSTRQYLVVIPTGTPPVRAGRGPGDTLRVTVCPDDPQLVGRLLRVVDVAHGSVLWERDLICTDELTANNP